MRRSGRGALLVGFLMLATSAPTSAQDLGTTTTPTTAPPKCIEGVTFTRLKRRDAHRIVVKASEANIRKLPGLGCPILTTVTKGRRFKTTGRRARSDKAVWLEVKTKKYGKGWIYQGLVRDA